MVSYPWGTFPVLRLGQMYRDGVFHSATLAKGHPETIQLPDLRQGQVVIGFDLPSSLMFFQKRPELGLQRVVKYTINSIEYFIPVMEWIRCLFVKNRTLAYLLLQPHGIDLLVDNVVARNGTLFIGFNRRLPEKLARPNEVLHLAWVLTVQGARGSWDSVYSSLFRKAVAKGGKHPLDQFQYGIPLDINLPPVGPCELTVRCIRSKNQVLVLEVLGISNMQVPLRKIVYSHPALKKQVSVAGDKKIIPTNKSKDNDYELNPKSENAKEDVHQDVMELPATVFGFVQKPKIEVDRKDVQSVNTGGDSLIPGRGGKLVGSNQIVSTEDSIFGGDTPPIEFSSMQAIPTSEGIGLEEFFHVIKMLAEMYQVKVHMSVVPLPPGRRFSICSNGVRRTCAIVQVSIGVKQKYILEIARPDGWSISTLILDPINQTSMENIEYYIKGLLEGLVNKSGHWDKEVLNEFREIAIHKLKHYKNANIKRAVIRLGNKL
ncbi:Tn7-like element transposition protein TnsE [Brevibacillus sp. HD3.3A]|uniref:Tn7-like element transposition protein TnsE n=1 Tax=Brevibacillus sp. HD3.3A TaxID=2738979 RepID=UPI00156BA2CC|nr:Tn7-like element transposition protein TnsE [Brevibacillus sp. HD3.3A]UED69444.1 Tn7-like element transposition protein TnsE [Brevibacillus sp. HD3.3A]